MSDSAKRDRRAQKDAYILSLLGVHPAQMAIAAARPLKRAAAVAEPAPAVAPAAVGAAPLPAVAPVPATRVPQPTAARAPTARAQVAPSPVPARQEPAGALIPLDRCSVAAFEPDLSDRVRPGYRATGNHPDGLGRVDFQEGGMFGRLGQAARLVPLSREQTQNPRVPDADACSRVPQHSPTRTSDPRR
jgi:hypothetical protein